MLVIKIISRKAYAQQKEEDFNTYELPKNYLYDKHWQMYLPYNPTDASNLHPFEIITARFA